MSGDSKTRNWFFTLIKVGVTVLLFWLLTQRIDVSDIVARLSEAWVPGLILALGTVFTQLALNAARWRLLAALDGIALPYRKSFRFYLEAMFFNQALPGAIGGDVMRVYRIRSFCVGLGQAVNSVILDRVTGLIGLATLIAVGLPLLLERTGDQSLLTGFGAIAVVGLGGTAMVLLVARLAEDGPGGRLRGAVVRFARLFDSLARHPRTAVPILLLALSTHVAVVIMATVAARALDLPFGFLDCLIVVPMSVLIATLPISLGGWGVREGAMAAGFTLIGGTAADGVTLSIAIGLLLLAVGIVGGAVWFFGGAVRPDAAILASEKR